VVSWPEVLEPCAVKDLSNRGAKGMYGAKMRTKSVVRLQVVTPAGAPLRVGVAFSFARIDSWICGCGVEFKRWVTPKDADEDLLRSASQALEN
jgi:hypothetical protein